MDHEKNSTERIVQEINSLRNDALAWSQEQGNLSKSEKEWLEISLDALQDIATTAMDLVDTFSAPGDDLDKEMAKANRELTAEIALGTKEIREEFEVLKASVITGA